MRRWWQFWKRKQVEPTFWDKWIDKQKLPTGNTFTVPKVGLVSMPEKSFELRLCLKNAHRDTNGIVQLYTPDMVTVQIPASAIADDPYPEVLAFEWVREASPDTSDEHI